MTLTPQLADQITDKARAILKRRVVMAILLGR